MRKKIIFLIFFISLSLTFLFTFGLRILLNTSIFIANISSKNKPTEFLRKNNEYISLSIDNIPSATNSSSILIEGTSLNIDEISIYLNNEETKTLKNFFSSNFTEEISGLKEGENEIYLIGKNTEKNLTKKTPVYKTIYKSKKPKIQIIEPVNEEKVNKNEVNIKGETDKDVYVKINNNPVIVDALGRFNHPLRLNEGENQITITAEDIAGNIEEKIIKIIYEKD